MSDDNRHLVGPFEVLRWPERPGSTGLARHRSTHEHMFVKTSWFWSLAPEAHTLNAAAGGLGIPLLHWFEVLGDKDILIIDSYGATLEETFNDSSRHFSMQLLLLLAQQLVSRLEFIHSRNIVHGNLNPRSFAFGSSAWQNRQVFLVDFDVEIESRGDPRNDLLTIGQILSYFYHGRGSWDDYMRHFGEEWWKNTAPVFTMFWRAVSTTKWLDYAALGRVFRDSYHDLSIQVAVALDLKGPRAVKEEPIPDMGEMASRATILLFDDLALRMMQMGKMVGARTATTHLFEALDEVLKIYMVLLIRDQASGKEPCRMTSYSLPSRLWRDMCWLLQGMQGASKASRLGTNGKIYHFVAALHETIPCYKAYWTEYSWLLARNRKDLEPGDSKTAWVQTVLYWQDRLDTRQGISGSAV